jgi:hypothetical protein
MIKFIVFFMFIVSSYATSESIESGNDSNISAFLALPFTEEDKNTSKEIINDMLGRSVESLLDNLSIIEEAKAKIEKISILKLLAFALSDPESAVVIRGISSDEIKMHFFTAWISLLFNDLKDSDPLFINELSGFSEFLSLEKDEKFDYINLNDYRDFISYLLLLDLVHDVEIDTLITRV